MKIKYHCYQNKGLHCSRCPVSFPLHLWMQCFPAVWGFSLFSVSPLFSFDTGGSFSSQLPGFGEFLNLGLPGDKMQVKWSRRASGNHDLFIFVVSCPIILIAYYEEIPLLQSESLTFFFSVKTDNSVHSLQQQLTFHKCFVSARQTLCWGLSDMPSFNSCHKVNEIRIVPILQMKKQRYKKVK